MKQFKYITTITEEELASNVVISCINENNMPCILIKNKLKKTVNSFYSTDNLDVKFNAVLKLHDIPYYFHIITSKKNDAFSASQFAIVFEYVFNKIGIPIDESGLSLLFGSIEEFFKTTADNNPLALQIGVFGELLVVKQIYYAGYKSIIEKYHKDFFLKHDIEINDQLRIEIKTTSSSRRIHRFQHAQIHRNDIDVFVASSMIEEAQEGLSLYDLFIQVIALYDNPDDVFALQKTMKRCNVSNANKGIIVSEEKALKDIKYYDARLLPQIPIDDLNGVTNISYDVDCSFTPDIGISEFINILL